MDNNNYLQLNNTNKIKVEQLEQFQGLTLPNSNSVPPSGGMKLNFSAYPNNSSTLSHHSIENLQSSDDGNSMNTMSMLANQAEPLDPSLSENSWMIHWFNNELKNYWSIKTPKFKSCKRRVEDFKIEFPQIWYKAPYKYHLLLDIEGVSASDNLSAVMSLVYEDGKPVTLNNNKPPVTNNHNVFSRENLPGNDQAMSFQSTIGPFQYNLCSYKQDGRNFRSAIYIYRRGEHSQELCASLLSSPFIIRAKKTKKKRKRTDSGEGVSAQKKKRLNNNESQAQSTNNILDRVKLEQEYYHKFFSGKNFISTFVQHYKNQIPDHRFEFLTTLMGTLTPAEKELLYRHHFTEFHNRPTWVDPTRNGSNSLSSSKTNFMNNGFPNNGLLQMQALNNYIHTLQQQQSMQNLNSMSSVLPMSRQSGPNNSSNELDMDLFHDSDSREDMEMNNLFEGMM